MANYTAMLEVQAGVIALLRADSALTGLADVYDDVLEGAKRPYVELGEIEETLDNTFGKHGRDVLVSLHIYSEEAGYKQAQQILERLIALLDEQVLPDTPSWKCGMTEYVIGSAMKELDVLELRHLIARFRFVMFQP